MNESSVGFVVNGVVTDVDSTYRHVIGRCGDAAIHIDDVFRVVDVPAGAFIDSLKQPTIRDESRSVQLRVKRIQAYSRELNELGAGMAGTIDLSGEGLEWVVEGAVLRPSVAAVVSSNPSNDLSSHS